MLFPDVIAAEKDGRGIRFENETAIVFVPCFARYACEFHAAPKATHASVALLGPAEVKGLAEALSAVLIRFDTSGGRLIDATVLLEPIRRLHAGMRDAVVASCEDAALEDMARVSRDGEGDTIYAVDRVSEERIVDFFAREIAPRAPLVLVAEGLEGGMVLPRGTAEADALWRVIVDPIDGTRGLILSIMPDTIWQ